MLLLYYRTSVNHTQLHNQLHSRKTTTVMITQLLVRKQMIIIIGIQLDVNDIIPRYKVY